MLGVDIVDKRAGTKVKTTLFLKPLSNVVEGCPTILRTAIQSNTMVTQETVDRCPAGWNTCLKVGVECSYRTYFTDGGMNHGWDRMSVTPSKAFIPGSGWENVSCKGYRQCLRYYVDETDVNLGTVLSSLCKESGLVCGYMDKTGRSFRSSLRQGKPVTWRRETVRLQCKVKCKLSRRKDV